MRHIKLFEDYTEEDLRDLQDTLHDIGHKSKLIQGEDFGFGTSLKEINDGSWFLTLTDETKKILEERGILKKQGSGFIFSNPQEWRITGDGIFYSYKLDPSLIWRFHETEPKFIDQNSHKEKINLLDSIAEMLGKTTI